MKKILSGLALAFSALLSTPSLATPVTITQADANTSAESRIDLSGKLRMLSQRIPAAACHINLGAGADSARETLLASVAEFNAILTGLENGDAELGIHSPELRRQTLADIAQLRELWQPFEAAANAVAAGNATEAELTHLLTENTAVLAAAQRLVEELVQQYANPNATTHASLMLIDIAGRQRMLTQKISKHSCVLGSPNATAETREELERTIQIYEASLEALRFGMPSVGITPPPNEDILRGLNTVQDDWSNIRLQLGIVLAQQELDADAHRNRFQNLNMAMTRMNDVVGLYRAAAR